MNKCQCLVSAANCPVGFCQNGGTCFENTCTCTPRFWGQWCHLPVPPAPLPFDVTPFGECEPGRNPCQNNGRCEVNVVNGVRQQECICEEPYYGNNCQFGNYEPN